MRSINLTFALTCATLLGAACSQEPADSVSQPKIFGGQADPSGLRYPSLVKLMTTQFGTKRFYCSAIAIGGPYILTASHCLKDTETGQDGDPKTFTIESVGGASYGVIGFVAENYGLQDVDDHKELSGQGADLAVMKIDRDYLGDTAELVNPVEFADLPGYLEGMPSSSSIEAAGFGMDNFSFKGGKYGTLNYVAVKYQSALSEGRELHLGESWKTTCSGDSGGGSFLRDTKNRLIGIVSRSFLLTFEPCGEDDKGHIATNLAHLENRRFIDNAKEHLRPLQPTDPDPDPTPQAGVFPIPGRIEAEDYRFALNDTTPGNIGNKKDYQASFRPSDYSVDLFNDNGGVVVGSTEKNEVLTFQADVKTHREFVFKVEASRGQSKDGGVTVRFNRNGVTEKTLTLQKTDKKGWNTYKVYEVGKVTLEKGAYQVEVTFDTPVNLDRLIFE